MRAGGWKPFWAALCAALLLFLPLAGGTVLLARTQVRQSRVQAAESRKDVAVDMPKESDRLTLLVCTAAEKPGFALLYLNAGQNRIGLLSVPGELAVPFGEGEATLTECYAAAGPARCREALSEAFSLPEDTRYLALTPETLCAVVSPLGSLRVSLAGALSADELNAADIGFAVRELDAEAASKLLARLDILAPSKREAARAAVWDAFFRQKEELLPSALPAALRAHSSAMLTDMAAQDYYRLEETLEFLANGSAPVWSAAMPGDWDAAGSRCSVSDASRAAVQALFNISPTSEQPSSDIAP